MASEVLMTISKDEVERAWLRSEEKYVLDTQSKLTYAKREGHQEEKLEIARNFKKMGLSFSQIAEGTGLSTETIQKL
jgi:predicted transposase/invertase (TIGR01784 family)